MVHVRSRERLSLQQGLKSRPAPDLHIRRLGVISRDYRERFPNKYRDFSYSLPGVLKLLDSKKCDAALFSLFGIVPRPGYRLQKALGSLKNLRAVLIEEFSDERSKRNDTRFVVYYRSRRAWHKYHLDQVFGSLTRFPLQKLKDFVAHEMPRRMLGNSCILLCGESNGVKYSRSRKRVEDTFGLRKSIPKTTNVILNPVHDRMTRFEMNFKRRFLSENGRWVISVWNKGKKDRAGHVKDGKHPPWTVFHNGRALKLDPIQKISSIEIGVLDITSKR